MSPSEVVAVVSVVSSAVVGVAGAVSSGITRRGDRKHEVNLRDKDWANGVRELRAKAYVSGLVYARRAIAETRDGDSQAVERYSVTAEIDVYGSPEAARLWREVLANVPAALDSFARLAQRETAVKEPS
jgi:hypothetical protein